MRRKRSDSSLLKRNVLWGGEVLVQLLVEERGSEGRQRDVPAPLDMGAKVCLGFREGRDVMLEELQV